MNKKEVKKAVKEFLRNPEQKKLELKVPKDFKMSWISCSCSVLWRKFWLKVLSKMPPMHFKTWLFNRMGYNFERDVCLPGYIDMDPYFPKLIELDEGVLVGGLTKIRPWKLEKGKLSLSRIYVGPRVLLAGWSTLLPGAFINKGTITGMKCLIDDNIPENSFVIGHNRVLKTWDKKELNKYFCKSKHDPDYAKKYREKTKKFRKDKKMRSVTIVNHGNRLNAGCDWWRARPVWRIYYNGILVELSLLCPFEPIRKLLYKLMGVKWGKNFKLGKKVTFDHIYGDMVTIGDNVTVGDGCFFDGHEYTIAEGIYGRTIVGNNVKMKAGSFLRAGITVRDNALIDGGVMKDVGEGEHWKGFPAKKVEK